MRLAIAHPCFGSSATVRRISRSSVPWTRSLGLPMNVDNLQNRIVDRQQKLSGAIPRRPGRIAMFWNYLRTNIEESLGTEFTHRSQSRVSFCPSSVPVPVLRFAASSRGDFPMKNLLLALLFVAASVVCVAAQDTPEFLHSPTISRSQIVFVYADELWSVSRQGGAAHLLTSGPGVKSSPSLSPNGQWLAFSLQDEGNVDVYVMPAEGGVAKRLTFHPTIDDVVGWTPDSKHILFRSNRNSYSRFNRLFTVSLDGGLPYEVPLPMAETGSYSADGSHLAYVPFTNARRLDAIAWRRYRGGNAARVWIARMSDSEIVKVPREDSQDWDPMWIGDKVYFISDRHDGIAGL